MNWDAMGAIGEVVGALAVVVTLIYLAMQIRHNTAAQETTSIWLMTQISNQTHTSILENREVADLCVAAQSGELKSKVDVQRVYSLVMPIVNIYFAAWRAHKNGHLPDDAYEALRRDARILDAPGFRPLLVNALKAREAAFIEEFFEV